MRRTRSHIIIGSRSCLGRRAQDLFPRHCAPANACRLSATPDLCDDRLNDVARPRK
jgi:hypothetical protein